jgi:hypothetical protein
MEDDENWKLQIDGGYVTGRLHYFEWRSSAVLDPSPPLVQRPHRRSWSARPDPESQVRIRLPAGGSRIRTCMGLFLSSGRFWFFAGSLFGAGKPFFVPSPAIRFAERAEGVKGPKR